MSEVHDNIRSLIAAYAIGAVPEEEIPPIRAHILTCEECFTEAESFAQGAAVLSNLVDPVPLPAGFEERVLQQVRGEAAASSREKAVWGGRLRVSLVGGALLVLVALLVLTMISFFGSLARQRQYEMTVAALVRDRDGFELNGPGGAEAIIASTSSGSVLVALDLGDAPEGRDYQLWLMKDGEPTPADTFDVSGSIVIVESSRVLAGFDGAAVTVEPEGGSRAPTTEPVLSTTRS